MKVLYVISTLGGGGAESQLCSYALAQKMMHPEIEFHICAIKKGGVFEQKLLDNQIEYTVLNKSGLFGVAAKLRKVIKSGKYDIVHAHMFFSDIACRFATIGLKAKLVATHHGLGKWKKKSYLALDKLTKGCVDKFVMVSEQSYKIREKREKYPSNKMCVIYNGISSRFLADGSLKLPSGDNRIIIGSIARMTDNKQLDLMIKVIEELKERKNLYYEIIGEGENYGKLVTLAEELKISDRVKFYGWVDDVIPITRNWHIFALPSINEDLPVSMLECMAQGIVPIASSVGGIITLLDNGENGILCDSKDRETFKNAIMSLLENKELYARMSSNCIETVKKDFLIEGAVQKTLEVYNEITV